MKGFEKWSLYLTPMYSKIVLPFKFDIQQLMIDSKLTSESDLYNSLCSFKYMNLMSGDNGDHRMSVEERLLEMVSKYQVIL